MEVNTMSAKNYAVVRNHSSPPKEDEWYVADSRELADGATDWLQGDYAIREEAQEVVNAISRYLIDHNTFPEAVCLATGYALVE